jgi:hypothetical protein
MRKLVPLIAIAALVVGFVALFWAFEYRQRATQAQVTRAVYRVFGRRGARIRCFAQTGNGARWNCASARWGDDPACRQVVVNVLGSMNIRRQTVICEG